MSIAAAPHAQSNRLPNAQNERLVSLRVVNGHEVIRGRHMTACARTCAASSGVMASNTSLGLASSSLRMLIMPSFLSAACMEGTNSRASLRTDVKDSHLGVGCRLGLWGIGDCERASPGLRRQGTPSYR